MCVPYHFSHQQLIVANQVFCASKHQLSFLDVFACHSVNDMSLRATLRALSTSPPSCLPSTPPSFSNPSSPSSHPANTPLDPPAKPRPKTRCPLSSPGPSPAPPIGLPSALRGDATPMLLESELCRRLLRESVWAREESFWREGDDTMRVSSWLVLGLCVISPCSSPAVEHTVHGWTNT